MDFNGCTLFVFSELSQARQHDHSQVRSHVMMIFLIYSLTIFIKWWKETKLFVLIDMAQKDKKWLVNLNSPLTDISNFIVCLLNSDVNNACHGHCYFILLKRKIIFSSRKMMSWRNSRWSYETSRENWLNFGVKLKQCKAPFCLGWSMFSPTTRNKNVSFSTPHNFSFWVQTCVI